MKIYFVRHGETDWRQLDAKGVKGWARSFAPLTPIGRAQIDAIASDYRLEEVEAILCSSYARALESAARLSRVLNKPLYVEYDLHEWLPQKDPLGSTDAETAKRAYEEFTYYTGFYPGPERRARRDPSRLPFEGDRRVDPGERQIPPAEARDWESLDEVRERALRALSRYQHLETVAVVTHAVVIASLIGVHRQIEHAEIVPFEIDLDVLEAGTGVSSATPNRSLH